MAIVINLSDDFGELFDELLEKTPFEDESVLISNAIALLNLVCEAREFGFKIAMVDEFGEIDDYIQGF
jgi:hypothetical protein